MSALQNAFKGFDPNDMDFNAAGNWPIGVKIVCYLMVMIAIGAAGWHFYITDKQVALKKEIAKESGLKAVYEEKAFQVANLAALRKQMEDVEDKFTELKKQLPTEKEVPGLLDDITNLGTDSGLDIGSIKLAAESKKEFYIELPININVSGSYHQLGQFVSGIAGLPRIVTLHDYTIKPSGTTVSMQISAKTYRYDETK
ncbi:type 4a pilus biogenesis protein PilO [Neptuniibacter pectenicola]|jgi:type IV pilus assembly protein PilO|uniref:type 4a pilus biogenesis protein PilO n=1 Tax=Neptuniibacter pectenicola TaxID=1806669 RepID=UPI000796B3ED|nr:type 4a pilus biogenesis protein PilO [Neptuniibacter pectenicola]KXJ55440.1 MAG: pilus assembly protein PilP [Neptuniibacter sp. Phe_28]